ncbi:competence protein ComEA [Streptomyces sp. TverLS-915]|uniref:helix-hairpin-helix domain-containing protein n=1 Tax=unclassified Streptomyces TaxID=2593676 RepID=UPI00081EFD94|nr:helix-hairpin-helix domain-containing protein [Streptomyces sp. TverLS-915]SCD29891.1 competence protein ComEA [Streptomyces sp. TverLS-915]
MERRTDIKAALVLMASGPTYAGDGRAPWARHAGKAPPRGAPGTETPAVASPFRRGLSAVADHLPLWLRSRFALDRRGVLALAVVLLGLLGVAGQHWWSARPQPVAVPAAERAASVEKTSVEAAQAKAVPSGSRAEGSGGTGEGGGAEGGGGAGLAPGAERGALVVDVGGEVREPGVRRLAPGSRVEDALRAAGGVRKGADLQGLNRARPLVDGELVWVGSPPPGGFAAAAGTGTTPGQASASGGAHTGATPSGAGAAPVTPVSLNAASLDQLDGLPGVGPVLAQRILDHRVAHGRFGSVDELREVTGIGERRFAELREYVRL